MHYLARIEQGDLGDPRAHIHHAHPPEEPLRASSYLLELWATFSTAFLVIALVVLLSVPNLRGQIWIGLLAVIGSFVLHRINFAASTPAPAAQPHDHACRLCCADPAL